MERGNLCLTRRLHESLWIGDIEVKVGEIRPGRIKLNIIAPKDVPISRFSPADRAARAASEAAT